MVTADRVRLGCYGLNGGKAGQPFCVTVDAEGEGYDLGGLVDGEPVLKGQIVRVVTTGGGGWGDPLQRELELVLRDVIEGRVSLASAENDYGVIFTTGTTGQPEINEAATKQLRADLKKAQNAAPDMIDRGVGYEKMLRGEHRPRMR
ncbi:MAG: hydantoinase B/oxoprolinase family protein [Bradyrhizobium sp.]